VDSSRCHGIEVRAVLADHTVVKVSYCDGETSHGFILCLCGGDKIVRKSAAYVN
jgi:hypothetical protein